MKVVALSNLFNLITNLTLFGFGMNELCILEVEENHLFNGNGPKWPIYFSSWHMHFQVEFELLTRIKVGEDILNLVMEL